jgi:hypothetical protein
MRILFVHADCTIRERHVMHCAMHYMHITRDFVLECVLIRERPVVKRNITSVTYRNMIIVKQKCNNYQLFDVTLSVSRDGSRQLIVGKLNQKNIYICNGTNYSSVTTLRCLPLTLTGWATQCGRPDGNIVYTTVANFLGKFSRVVTMSQNGDVIALTNMTNAALLSVSANNVVYLADAVKGVYQSSNGGRHGHSCLI